MFFTGVGNLDGAVRFFAYSEIYLAACSLHHDAQMLERKSVGIY